MKLVKVDGTHPSPQLQVTKRKTRSSSGESVLAKQKANKISSQASNRGNKFHGMVECYLKNEGLPKDETHPLASYLFRSAIETLDRINNIHLLEAPLYSDHLRIAGRVDCIAEFDGELAVIDFKTSTKPKQESWIENYFVQEAAYAAMYYERCGVEVQKVVTIIAVEDGTMQVIEKRNLNELYKLLQEYIHDFNTSYR